MDISKYVTIGDDGKIKIDTAGVDAEFDRARTQASDTASKNAETKLRASIEREVRDKLKAEAEMSAEEKFKAERESFMAEKRAFDVERIKKIYKDANISDDEIEILIASIGEDSEKNLETANKFAKARILADETARKKFQEELQFKDTKPIVGTDGAEESYGAKMAKKFSTAEDYKYVDLSSHNGD